MKVNRTFVLKLSIDFMMIALFLLHSGGDLLAETLYVFYPIAERPNVIQTKLSESCPGVDITVFGRINDFDAKMKEAPPDAILSKPVVIAMQGNYAVQLQGVRGGGTDESYVFLSVDKGVDPAGLASATVGVLDILSRKEMTAFVEGFIKPTPQLKRVTKMEDLLPLLTFNMASAILISENAVNYFKSVSQLSFVVTPASGMKTGIIALAVKKDGQANNTIKAIKEMKGDINTLLEVDSWK